MNTYLDLEDRVAILNSRLDIVNGLLDSLSNQLEIRQGHRLEKIVIALISVEIGIELLKQAAEAGMGMPPLLSPLLTWPRRALVAVGGRLFARG